MRSKLFVVVVAVLAIGLLSACGPAASALKTGVTAASAQNLVGSQPPSGAQNLPAAAPSSSLPQQSQPTTPPGRTIAVTGEGRATLTPDIAYVNIGVHTENADVAEAVAANRSQAQKVIDALKAQEVDAKDIQTTNFSIYPNQKYGPNGAQEGITYVVDNTVFVTVRKLDNLGTLLDSAISAGANNINSIQFDVADRTSALADARAAAVKNAHDIAEALAGTAGVQLGPVQSINLVSNSVPQPVYAVGMGGGAAAPAASVPVSSGQLIITVDANLVYEIQ